MKRIMRVWLASRAGAVIALGVICLLYGQTGLLAAGLPGKAIVENRCVLCHDAPDPERLSKEEWVVKLETMADYAGLSKMEKQQVLEYLTTHGKSAITIVSMAEERKLFEQKCSLCHTTNRVLLMPLTPDARRHIVQRMQERAPDWISTDEVHEILEYLNHGAPESIRPERKKVSGGAAAIFRERCTACHTAERVYLRLRKSRADGTAVTWAHIVNRMREKSPEWISRDEAQQIIDYLGTIRD